MVTRFDIAIPRTTKERTGAKWFLTPFSTPGNTTTFEYDEVGNLIATTDPLGNRTLRFYDAVSRLIALVDARGKSTQFTYDNLNRVTQIQDAINGITSFTYDPNGNLLTVTDAKNQTTTYTYDSMDRLATRKDALNRTETYAYDLAGNLTTFTDRKNQVTTFQYDALNRRIQAIYPDASTTFTYDAVGRLVKASDTAPGAGTIDFAYDILDRLIQETTPLGTVAYQYDVLGCRTQMTANGQQATSYQYDAASRLTRVAQGSLFAALGYDNANRRTSLGYSNGTNTSYGYDFASRLMNITHNGPSGIIEALTYSYDAAGNRLSLTRANGTASLLPSAVTSASYDAANEQTAFAGATLTYDANGNLTNDGTNTYQWDVRNRLTGMSGGVTASFVYDSLGRRISKTINGESTQYAYDGNDITAEIGGGAVGVNYLRSLNIDEPFIRQLGTGNEHYHTDALGSSLALSNTAGASAASYIYEPFGKTTAMDSSSNPFQFTNREIDGSGFYYYRARYYSPRFQRFLGEDPLALGGGDLNFYVYVRNVPTVFTDPNGLYIGFWHYVMSFYASMAEGCSLEASHKIASANVDTDTDFDAFDPALAYIHGQYPPGSSPVQAILDANQFIIDQLKTDSLAGLGHALHTTEDPQAGGHLWTQAPLEPRSWWQWITPYWGKHLLYDILPFGMSDSIARDRKVIRQFMNASKRKVPC